MIGSRGRTRVTGGQLRARFGLFDTWAFFTSISTGEEPPPEPEAPEGPPTGGTEPFGSAALAAPPRRSAGSPAACCRCSRAGPRSCSAATARPGSPPARSHVQRGGRYAYDVTVPGVYRVRYHDENGPAVRVS